MYILIDTVVVKYFCNTLFGKFTLHTWLQTVYSNGCRNGDEDGYTIHTHICLLLHPDCLLHKNDWDKSIHFLKCYKSLHRCIIIRATCLTHALSYIVIFAEINKLPRSKLYSLIRMQDYLRIMFLFQSLFESGYC